jgi:hypothetical protein
MSAPSQRHASQCGGTAPPALLRAVVRLTCGEEDSGDAEGEADALRTLGAYLDEAATTEAVYQARARA